jgi:signal transduction histidine kinase
LWFMNQAMTTESTAARQRVQEAYRGQLRLVRSRLDGVWRAQATRLNADGDSEQGFARLITGELAEGALLLGGDGSVAYPNRQIQRDTGHADLERRLAALSNLSPRDRAPDIALVAARLNDYTLALSSTSRLKLMDRLRTLAPNVWLPTQAALQLSMDLLDVERPAPVPDVLRQTALHDTWALTSTDRRVVGLYRTGRVEEMMHDFLHEISPEGIVFIAYPPDEQVDAEAIAAGPWLPGWQLSFMPLDPRPFDQIAKRRRAVYLSVALVAIALMVIVGAAAGGGLRRHLRLARLKTDLVAAASHELRTPLASMRLLVDGLLADAVLDPTKTREYLELLAVENGRLSRLIDNFLTFSRLDRHRYHFTLEPVAPATIVASALAAIRDRVPPTSALHIDIEDNLPSVRADREALPTALVNLLDNALKYTPAEKRIDLRVRHDRDSLVSFAVTDNGIGIPAGERRRIFRRFHRVDQRLSQETSGVGLGLSIVELIVRGHHGRVHVESEAGSGSTFTIQVPAMAKDDVA